MLELEGDCSAHTRMVGLRAVWKQGDERRRARRRQNEVRASSRASSRLRLSGLGGRTRAVQQIAQLRVCEAAEALVDLGSPRPCA